MTSVPSFVNYIFVRVFCELSGAGRSQDPRTQNPPHNICGSGGSESSSEITAAAKISALINVQHVS